MNDKGVALTRGGRLLQKLGHPVPGTETPNEGFKVPNVRYSSDADAQLDIVLPTRENPDKGDKGARHEEYESDPEWTGSELNYLNPEWKASLVLKSTKAVSNSPVPCDNKKMQTPQKQLVDYSPSSNSTVSNASCRSILVARNILCALETRHLQQKNSNFDQSAAPKEPLDSDVSSEKIFSENDFLGLGQPPAMTHTLRALSGKENIAVAKTSSASSKPLLPPWKKSSLNKVRDLNPMPNGHPKELPLKNTAGSNKLSARKPFLQPRQQTRHTDPGPASENEPTQQQGRDSSLPQNLKQKPVSPIVDDVDLPFTPESKGSNKSTRKTPYQLLREKNVRENTNLLDSLSISPANKLSALTTKPLASRHLSGLATAPKKSPAQQLERQRSELSSASQNSPAQQHERRGSGLGSASKNSPAQRYERRGSGLGSASKNTSGQQHERRGSGLGSASKNQLKPSSPIVCPSDRVLRTRSKKSLPSSDENEGALSGLEELGEDSDWISDEEKSDENEDNLEQHQRSFGSDDVQHQLSDLNNRSASEDLHSDLSNGPQTPPKHKKEQRKLARARGKSYKTRKGRVVKARSRKQLEQCRMKCKEKLTDLDLDATFEEYWALGSTNRRWQYVADRIEVTEKKCSRIRLLEDNNKKKPRNQTQHYSLFIRGKQIPVCKKCFMAVLNETDRFVRTAVEKKMSQVSGVTPDDGRGRAAPANKFADSVKGDIITHINSYPRYKSHYSRRHTDKYYLGTNLTVASMHEAFNERAEVKVAYVTYFRVFQSLGYKFKEPSLDTCKTCDKLQATLQFAATEDEREEARKLKDDHVIAADFAYTMKKADREKAKNDKDGNFMVVTFDLEQCLPTPSLTTSSVFYLRQLWTYNLTVHDLKDGKAKAYMWAEPDGERGADQIASCVFTHVQENAIEMVTHIILWSDQCAGQNKNSHMAAMFMFLIKQRPTLQIVDQKFLVSGHTRMECDADHSLVERKKKKWTSPIHHPRDWFTLVGSCSKKMKVREMKNSDFLSFSDLLSGPMVGTGSRNFNTSGEKFLWHDVQWLRFKKNQFGLIHYKTSLKEEEDFKTFNLRRKTGAGKYRNELDIYVVPKSYDGPCRIAVKKKEDLLKLLHLIDPLYRPYYENLLTTDDIDANLDPDIPTSDEEYE